MLKKVKKNQKGFTLVELVVVIAILAVLAALLVPRIMGNVSDAKDQKEITNARTLAGEITVYNAQAKVDNEPQITEVMVTPTGGGGTPVVAPAAAFPAGSTYTVTEWPDPTVVLILVDVDGNATIDIQ